MIDTLRDVVELIGTAAIIWTLFDLIHEVTRLMRAMRRDREAGRR